MGVWNPSAVPLTLDDLRPGGVVPAPVIVGNIGGRDAAPGVSLGSESVFLTSGGLTVTDATQTRVHLGKLAGYAGIPTDSTDYGLVVLAPDGTTIIDGTSDIFRIGFSGTFSVPAPLGQGEDTNAVDLDTGVTTVPAFLAFTGDGASSGGMLPSIIWDYTEVTDYWYARMTGGYTPGDHSRLSGYWQSKYGWPAGTTYVLRYYVLAQQAF